MELAERATLYHLAQKLKRASWTIEFRSARAASGVWYDGMPYVRDEEGEPVGLLDDELFASLCQFFGVPRARA